MSSGRVIVDAIKMAQRLLWQNLPPAHSLLDVTTVMRFRDLVRSPAVQSALERGSDTFPAFALRAVERVLADQSRTDREIISRLWDVLDDLISAKPWGFHRIPASRSDPIQRDVDSMNLPSAVAVTAILAAHPTAAQDHRFETDPVATVRENFVACEVLSQLQRVMDNPRFLLTGECEPLSAGRRVRIYANRRPYVCIYPADTIAPCKWTHEKVLSK
jgi:hypothetical protein